MIRKTGLILLSVIAAVIFFNESWHSRVLTTEEAEVIRGFDPYDCEACNSALVTQQCTGPVSYPENPCRQVADPPVQGQTCDGSCGAIYCSGGAEKDRCSTSGFIPFHLCNCSMGEANFTCGVKVVANPPCNENWGDPGGGQPLFFRYCSCDGNPTETQWPCKDDAIDPESINTSCPGGYVIVYSYPSQFDRSKLLASIQ
jgi:hypothetical protein